MTFVKEKMLYLLRHNSTILGHSGMEKEREETIGEKGMLVHPDELSRRDLCCLIPTVLRSKQAFSPIE
jgi:hypothetical protein